MNPSKIYNQNLLVKNDILATLAYFDIFTYPLKEREIRFFLPNHYSLEAFEEGLQEMIEGSLIFKLGEFYSLQNNYAIVMKRIQGNEKAQVLIQTAKKVGSLLSQFPFVRGVAISGSLSKNFADESSDIDLFLITSKNRLWLARTILHCFKKLTFLTRKEHFYCMNYFIEENHVEIAEKNIYTATEIATLMPLEGNDAFEKFYSANAWTRIFLPNKYLRVSSAEKIKMPWIKMLIEKILNNSLGNKLEEMLMNITANRWRKKTEKKQLNRRGHILGMSAGRYCAKPDPGIFQNKFLELYDRKVMELVSKKVIVMKC